MKSTLSTILASVALTLTVSAAPLLRIETTISQADHSVLSRPMVFTSSGKEAVIPTGDKDSEITYALTPTLLDNGMVDLQATATQRNGEKITKLEEPRVVVKLGEVVKSQVGDLLLTVKTSLAE